jgi:hypothetical protein
VIHGCYKSRNGQLHLIDLATDSCRPSETAISWSETGAARAAGADGTRRSARAGGGSGARPGRLGRRGRKGRKATRGDPGAPATSLWAVVTGSAALVRSSEAMSQPGFGLRCWRLSSGVQPRRDGKLVPRNYRVRFRSGLAPSCARPGRHVTGAGHPIRRDFLARRLGRRQGPAAAERFRPPNERMARTGRLKSARRLRSASTAYGAVGSAVLTALGEPGLGVR